jgi:hypothetical protein
MDTLRFIAYSSSNKILMGAVELFRFKLKPAVSSGTYSLNIVAHSFKCHFGNIESDSFDGSLTINAQTFP